MNLDLLTSSYDYILPKELIASHPVHPADSAKLLVYDRASDTITHTVFSKILDFIPKDCSIFLNDTKVIKARIFGNKRSGGKIELLLDKPIGNDRFVVYIRGKVSIDTIIDFGNSLKAQVVALNEDGSRIVEFFENDTKIDFARLIVLLDNFGHVPLPPYIQRADTTEDVTEYQSLFAKVEGAVAAPTASLHFTPELLDKLKQKFDTFTLTLHVGSGTFKPVDCNKIEEHQIHSELFSIPDDTAMAITGSKPILAIGTTVARTIEFFHKTGKISGECDIFLHPQNIPKRVNHLLTNFHLPKSTLIMLVSSFIGREKTIEIYNEAIRNNYRFYSYGDTILIL